MKVSVIIPVYNSASYIEKCILSILNQTYYNYELIVVNDGSTDNSLEKLQELLSNKSNTQIITQNNQGVSGARNTGIRHATGTYITFIDCDDYVSSNYLETLIEGTHNGKFDWILSGTSYIQGNNETKVLSMTEDIWNYQELDSKFHYIDYTTSIHGKLYKKEIIDKYNLRFNTSMSFAEDRDFNIEFIRHLKTAHNISYVGYTYCTDIPNSLSKKKYHYKFKNDCIYWNKVLMLNNKSQHFKRFVANRLYNAIVDNIYEMNKWLGIKQTLKIIHKDYTEVNKRFIITNQKHIKAPTWQKNLVIYCISLLCFIIYLKIHFNS